MIYLITAAVLLIYLLFAWLLGSWMHLAAPGLWVLRGGLALIGAAAAAAFVWFRRARGGAPFPEPDSENELDLLLRAADAKLHSARSTQSAGLGSLPLVMVVGPSGSTKTSVVTHSGLDPELLAGRAFDDNAVIPTRTINVWYGSGAVFVEAAGTMLADPGQWAALVRRIAPPRLRPVLGGGTQAPRAALVCFDTETFFGAGAEAPIQARLLRARLGEVSQTLGVQLPVYVLFTRMDRVPFFADYVRSLEKAEAEGVLGATLPLEAPSAGLYADEQSARIGASFDELFHSVAAARLDLLPRDHDDLRAGCAWEFPREFRKLRTAITDFLVELCRPSQFSVGPALRGYYFTGVRSVIVEDVFPTVAMAGATVLFRSAAMDAPSPVQPVRGARKVPQWVFLPQLFRDVILSDRAAMGTSAASARTSAARRSLLALAAGLGLLATTPFTVSWTRNRSLENAALAAARGPVDSLERLDNLRESLETLARYRSDGAPLSYRWGLYHGDALYPELRRIYFVHFRKLLFADTQAALIESLRALPSKPGPDCGPVYDTLKAYLITTSNPEHSTRAFLAPVLLERWQAGRSVAADRSSLAARQFAFYADELKNENPYIATNDAYSVAKARDYLAQFAGIERVYRAMLADAAKAAPAVDFNHSFPSSAAAVVDPYIVNGAFTKPGWEFMKTAVRNPDRYFNGEQWVLGEHQSAAVDPARLEDQLRTRYQSDFLKEWRAYLRDASVLRYANLADAARKLNLLAGNQSPLLAVLALASGNTAVDDPAVAAAFQPVQAVVPPSAGERLIAPPNQPYMNALLELQSSIEQAAGSTDAAAVLSAAGNAKVAARQAAQTFRPDPAGHVDTIVENLLESPITSAEALLRVLGPEELNGKGKALCSAIRPLFAKFPFDANASAEATVAEVNAVFRRPDGALWGFYDTNLQKLVIRQGSQFVPSPNASVHITPAFLAFLNQASGFTDALYSGGSQDPHFTFTLKPVPVEGIQTLGVTLDGQTLSYSGGTAAPKQFTWTGNAAHEAKASVRFGSGPDLIWSNSQGPWAIFRFFDKAEHWQASADGYDLDWTIRIGKDPVTLPNGKPLTVRFGLNTGGLPPILQRGYLSHFACVTQVAR